MFNDYSSRENRTQQRGWAGGIGVIVALGAGMAALQNNIIDYKTARAHISEAVILSPTAETLQGFDFAVLSGILQKDGTVIEPLGNAEVHRVAALWMTEERYQRRRKSSSWTTVNTRYAEAPAISIGNYLFGSGFLESHSSQIKQRAPLANLPQARMLARHPGYDSRGNFIYADSNHRYSFHTVSTGQMVTVMGKITGSPRRQAIIEPSPEMSTSYPAIWPGQLTPAAILQALTKRLVNTLLGIGGIIFLLGWVGMALLNMILPEQQRLGGVETALAACFGALGSVAFWYILPDFWIALPASLAICAAVFFIILTFFNPNKERTS